MYYLLEDNRIIKLYNAKFSECGLLKVYEETGKVTTLKLDGTIERYTGYFVKKQSENVFDLIEEGDLLKIKQPKDYKKIGGKYCFGEYKGPEDSDYASYIKEYFPKEILAIYKPDANGNYIKVWEKKDDN